MAVDMAKAAASDLYGLRPQKVWPLPWPMAHGLSWPCAMAVDMGHDHGCGLWAVATTPSTSEWSLPAAIKHQKHFS